MRSRSPWRTSAGVLAVLATAALSSPGVHAERTRTPDTEAVAVKEGPVCRAVEPPVVRYDTAAIQRAIAARVARQPESERADVVVLNGRGYNYPRHGMPATPPDPGPR